MAKPIDINDSNKIIIDYLPKCNYTIINTTGTLSYNRGVGIITTSSVQKTSGSVKVQYGLIHGAQLDWYDLTGGVVTNGTADGSHFVINFSETRHYIRFLFSFNNSSTTTLDAYIYFPLTVYPVHEIQFDVYGLNTYSGAITIKNIVFVNKTNSSSLSTDYTWEKIYSPIAVGRDINSDTSADLLGECIQLSRDRICDVNVNINVEGYNEKLVYEIPLFDYTSQQYSINQCVRYSDLDMSNANIVGGCVIFYKTTDNNALGYVGHTIGTSDGTNVTVDVDIYSSYGRLLYSQPIDYLANAVFQENTRLKEITIPNSVTSIGEDAFYKCSGLTSVTIPNSVTSIVYRAFAVCSSLTSVTIPNRVTSIGDYAFTGCSGLTSVTIGNSVTSIGDYAFRSCTSLTSITIPNSVTSIGDEAFFGCTSITSVIYNSVTYTSKSLLVSSLTNNGVSVGSNAFDWTGLSN